MTEKGACRGDSQTRRNEIKSRRIEIQAGRSGIQSRAQRKANPTSLFLRGLAHELDGVATSGSELGSAAALLASPPVAAELREDAVHLGEQFFPRGGVVASLRRARPAVAVEAVENLEVGRNRLEVAAGDRLGGERLRALKADELKNR